jgi:hypothetical protein
MGLEGLQHTLLGPNIRGAAPLLTNFNRQLGPHGHMAMWLWGVPCAVVPPRNPLAKTMQCRVAGCIIRACGVMQLCLSTARNFDCCMEAPPCSAAPV